MPDRQPRPRRFGGHLAFASAQLTHWGDGVRKAISIVVAVLLAVAVVSTIIVWTQGSPKKPLQVVRGVIGSEDKAFFGDPRVKAAFADTRARTASSPPSSKRQIATTVDRSKYDFAFGAGTPAGSADPLRAPITTSSVPFFTPMAVATFTDIAQLLEQAGVAHDHGGWWTLDMKGFLDLVARHVRWNQLPGNTTYPATNVVRITSTDVTTSNSAEMYASIASYVANQDRVLGSAASVDKVVNQVSPLFLEQNHGDQSTEALFHDYLSKGEGTTAMVMISEAQFVARAAAHDGSIRPNMVLMYPGSRRVVEVHARSAQLRRRHRRAPAHRRSEPPAARGRARVPHHGEAQAPSIPSSSRTNSPCSPKCPTQSSHRPTTSSGR